MLLAAGLGTRLRPLTDAWPKPLMPIGGRPLLEHWLQLLHATGIQNILVNVHHHADHMMRFLRRSRFAGLVEAAYETRILGTAGTLNANRAFFTDHTTLLVHADNWCQCNFRSFLTFHRDERPDGCPITMMTFDTSMPETCGIVETNDAGVVTDFYEKVDNPPGTRANGAVYLLETDVLEWMEGHPELVDFSTEVLPEFVGRIATWHNAGIHRDLGTVKNLQLAQQDSHPKSLWPEPDDWARWFDGHPIHNQIAELATSGVVG